jgi:hypothetical protein
VEGEVDIGDGRPNARAGLQPGAGVAYLVEHRAVEFLCDRPCKEAGDEPVQLHRFLAAHLVDRQAVEHGEHDAVIEHAADLRHQRPAGIERKVAGVQQEERQQAAPNPGEHLAQLRKAFRRERHRPVRWSQRIPRPGPRPSDRRPQHGALSIHPCSSSPRRRRGHPTLFIAAALEVAFVSSNPHCRHRRSKTHWIEVVRSSTSLRMRRLSLCHPQFPHAEMA